MPAPSEQKPTTESEFAEFVREIAAKYLTLPNVTSVGVGRKVIDGLPTGELSVQFTTATRLRPEDRGRVMDVLGLDLLSSADEPAPPVAPLSPDPSPREPGPDLNSALFGVLISYLRNLQARQPKP